MRGGNGKQIKRELNRRIGETVSGRDVALEKKVGDWSVNRIETARGGSGETENISPSPIHRFTDSHSPFHRFAK